MTELCHGCGDVLHRTFPEYQSFNRITSDCRPWPKGGTLAICQSCGLLQPIVDAGWRSEVDQIYKDYDVQILRDQTDQVVIVPGRGELCPRSTALLERIRDQIGISDRGRLLDVGCGSGAFLRAFAQSHPNWTLFGAERNDSCDPEVASIAGVEALFTCATEDIAGSFDLIVSVHSLEHITEPIQLLRALSDKLTKGGHLVLQLPYFFQNPFYLFVADHCSHFTRSSVLEVLRRSGFQTVDATADYVPKEMTVIARAAPPRAVHSVDLQMINVVEQMLSWLRDTARAARDASSVSRFGLWGSSVSSTWLFAELDGRVDFFRRR